jgi:hypothetical protein
MFLCDTSLYKQPTNVVVNFVMAIWLPLFQIQHGHFFPKAFSYPQFQIMGGSVGSEQLAFFYNSLKFQ